MCKADDSSATRDAAIARAKRAAEAECGCPMVFVGTRERRVIDEAGTITIETFAKFMGSP